MADRTAPDSLHPYVVGVHVPGALVAGTWPGLQVRAGDEAHGGQAAIPVLQPSHQEDLQERALHPLQVLRPGRH